MIPLLAKITLIHAIKLSTNPADIDHCAGLAAGGGCILFDGAQVMLWQTPCSEEEEGVGSGSEAEMVLPCHMVV